MSDGFGPLDKVVFTGTEWKPLRDCTRDDLLGAVEWVRRVAQTDDDVRAQVEALLEQN